MRKLDDYVYDLIKTPAKKKKVLLITVVLFVVSLLMFPTKIVLAKMLPGKSTNTYSVYVDLPTGSSIEQTTNTVECVQRFLKKEKEILDMETFLGQGAPLDYAGLVRGSAFKNSENVAEIIVNLTDKHHRHEASFLMVERLRPVVQERCERLVDGSSIKFVEQPAGPPTLAAIVVEVYGDSNEGLRNVALRIEKILKETQGLVDVDILQEDIYKKYELKVNKDKLLLSGLTIKQVNEILYLAVEGQEVAVKNSQNSPDQIPIFVVLSDETKKLNTNSIEDLKHALSSLRLMNPKGMMIPLSEVVYVREIDSHPSITHKDLKKYVNVVADTGMVSQVYPLLEARRQMISQFSDDFNVSTASMFNLKLEDKKTGEVYDLVWDGEMKVTLDTFMDLGSAFIASLILIFLLLVVYYKNFALSGIVLLGSFLSIIGVIFGHLIMNIFTSETFFLTATSLIGFIALMGISSRNSILLIDFTQSMIKDEGMDKERAIAYATATRAKPIFLTATAIILASTLLASDPVFGGLGVSLIFGTIAAVVVSLIVIPIFLHNTNKL